MQFLIKTDSGLLGMAKATTNQVHSEKGIWVPKHGEYEGYDHALLLEFGSAASWASSKSLEWPVRLRDPKDRGCPLPTDIPEEPFSSEHLSGSAN